jgi:uncharacterized protein (DUF305 family)
MHAYLKLAVMAVLSFIAMYILMYAMVDEFASVYPNINQFYMAGLMTAPMIVIELLVMRGMYENSAVNAAILVASVVALGVFFAVKSMIPHHSGAILMCGKAPIEDSEIKALCGQIIKSQREEIAQMKTMLGKLQK